LFGRRFSAAQIVPDIVEQIVRLNRRGGANLNVGACTRVARPLNCTGAAPCETQAENRNYDGSLPALTL